MTQPTVVATAPPGATFGALVLKVAATGAGGEVHNWDCMAIFPDALSASGPLPGFPGQSVPELSVQIALASNPLDSPQVWTDVTSLGVWSLELDQGRQHELSRTEAGKVRLTCDNTTRALDPDNTAGPYYPNLAIGKRIRAQAQWNKLSAANASLESSADWGNFGNCTLTRAAPALDGALSLVMTSLAAGDMMAITHPGLNGFPVKAGQTYTAMGFPRAATTPRACSVGIAFYNAGGGQIGSTVFSATVNDAVGSWPAAGVPWDPGGPVDLGQWFITVIDQKWPAGSLASTEIQAVDYLMVPNLITMLAPYPQVVLNDFPATYLRLQETGGAVAYDFSPNGANGSFYAPGGMTFGGTDPADPSGKSVAIQVLNTSNILLPGVVPLIGPFSIEAWINTPHAGNYGLSWPPTPVQLFFSFNASGTFATAFTVPGLSGSAGSTVSILDGAWHHVVATYDGTTVVVYVDGVAGATTGSGTATPRTSPQFSWSNGFSVAVNLAELAVYSVALSAAQVLNHFQAAQGWANDTTGQRIAHILNAIGIPASDQVLEVGQSPVQVLTAGGIALDLIAACQETENGLFFADSSGHMTFFGRWHLATNSASTVSQATFGDGASEIPCLQLPDVGQDDLDLWPVVLVPRQGGQVGRAASAAAATSFVSRTLTAPTSLATSDGEVFYAAQYLQTRFSVPRTRFRQVTVDGMANPAVAFPQILRRTLWDRVTVNKTPPPNGTGPRVSEVAVIEHRALKIEPGRWTWTIGLSPVDAVSYLVLDDPTFGQLDHNSLYY